MKRKLDIRKPPYGEQILAFCWPFVISRFFSTYFTTVKPPVMAFFFVPADSPYIDSCLNLSTMATVT